jgi:chemotaxis protein MotB
MQRDEAAESAGCEPSAEAQASAEGEQALKRAKLGQGSAADQEHMGASAQQLLAGEAAMAPLEHQAASSLGQLHSAAERASAGLKRVREMQNQVFAGKEHHELQLQSVKSQLAAAEYQAKVCRMTRDSCKNQMEHTQSLARGFEEQLHTALETKRTLNDQLGRLRGELSRMLGQLQEQQAAAAAKDEELQQLWQQLADANRRIHTMEEDLGGVRGQLQEQQAAAAEAQKRVLQKCARRNKAAEASAAAAAAAEAARARLQEAFNKLQEDSSAAAATKDKELQQLQQQLAEAKRTMDEQLGGVRGELQEQQAAAAAAERESCRLQEAFNKLQEDSSAAAAAKEEELQQLREQLSELWEPLRLDKHPGLERVPRWREVLTDRAPASTSTRDDLISALGKQAVRLLNEANRYETRYTGVKAGKIALEAETKALQGQLAAKQQQVQQLHQQDAASQQQVQQLHQQNAASQQEVLQLQSQVANLNANIAGQASQLQHAQRMGFVPMPMVQQYGAMNVYPQQWVGN